MASQAEVRESHEQFSEAWSLYARCSGSGEIIDMDGLRIANARQPWFLMNAALLTAPAFSQANLAVRARAIEYFGVENRRWFLSGSQQWLGSGSTETLSRLGLTKAVTIVGMVAEQLASPVRPLPEADTHRIDNEQGRLALADLNTAAYDVSCDWVRAAVAGESLWQSPLYGYVAYVDGHPVSTAFAVPLNGVLYVAFVATAIEHRRRGLAELVMRRSLADATRETGITRTALHASSDGYSIYIRMGYRPVDEFSVYVPS
ncbi:GNAT family N-acetyltransferase [Chloroflexi bacterium TSY]|nr:GNAT family N-acetyltransferase [Chloroflexi bacterium TSY]